MIPEALEGIPVEQRLVDAPGRARLAHRLVAARLAAGRALARRRSTSCTSPTGCTRRSAPGCARPRSTTSCRVHFPEWVTGRTRAMHTRKYENAARTCGVMFANSAFTADDTAATLGFPRERIVVAHPGIGAEYAADGEAADLGVPVPAHRRDARAAQEPRHARRRVRAARRPRARARGRRRRGLGAAAASSTGRASSGSAASPTTSWRGSTAARRRSSTRRASRASACRSPRRWRRARRSSRRRTRRWTRPAATRPCAPTPRAPSRSRPRSATRSRGATSCAREGLAHAAAVLVGADRRALPRGVPAIRVALDTTPLAQTRAGTARHVRGLLDHLDVTVRGSSFPATSRSRAVAARRALVPAAGAPTASTCSTARPSAGRSGRRRRSSSPSTTSPCCGTRSGSTAGRAPTRASPCRASCGPRRA